VNERSRILQHISTYCERNPAPVDDVDGKHPIMEIGLGHAWPHPFGADFETIRSSHQFSGYLTHSRHETQFRNDCHG